MSDITSIKIWLDDIRDAPDGWLQLRNINEVERFIMIVKDLKGFFIEEMEFDFNLGDIKRGIDVMKYLSDLCVKGNTKKFWPRKIMYHSTDTEGIEIMRSFAERFEKDVLNDLGN
jgi:hypothetical protein